MTDVTVSMNWDIYENMIYLEEILTIDGCLDMMYRHILERNYRKCEISTIFIMTVTEPTQNLFDGAGSMRVSRRIQYSNRVPGHS